MRLSFTALKTFRDCRHRYNLRYNIGLPNRPRPPAQSSRALHGALHRFHAQLQAHAQTPDPLLPDAQPSLESLLKAFQDYYDNPLRPLSERQYQDGRRILEGYWRAHQGHFPTPYLLEAPFKVPVGPLLLAGRLDRADAVADGYEIIDYKLSPRALAPDPLQLDVYQLGFQRLTGHTATQLSFYYLRTNEKESVEQKTIEAAQRRVGSLGRDIGRERAFRPQEGGWCSTCDFHEFCPAKRSTPKAVPRTGRAQQLGFDFG